MMYSQKKILGRRSKSNRPKIFIWDFLLRKDFLRHYHRSIIIFAIVGVAFTRTSHADQLSSFFRGPRALAMGGAATAIADNEEAIFYNPAGLALVKNFSLHAAALNAEASNDLIQSYPAFSNSLENPGFSTLNELMGKNLSLRAQGTTSLVFPGFGVAGIYQQAVSLQMNNMALPQGLVGHQNTYGVQMGLGWTLKKFKRKKGDIRMGVAGKMLWRSGGFSSIDLTQLLTFDYKSITNGFPGLGLGYGLDFGFQSTYNLSKKFSILSGLSLANIGTTSFASGAPPIAQNVTAGLAARYTGADVMATLTGDYSQLFDSMDWRQKTHLGLELKMPLLTLYTGLNQLHPTYGLGLDLLMFKVMYLSYAEDQTPLFNQNTERRHMIYVALKFEL